MLLNEDELRFLTMKIINLRDRSNCDKIKESRFIIKFFVIKG